MNEAGFVLFYDYLEQLDELTYDQIGELVIALMKYGRSGEEPDLSDAAIRIAFKFMRRHIDIGKENYQQKCMTKSECGKKGAQKRWSKNGKNSKNGSCYDSYENERKNTTSDDSKNSKNGNCYSCYLDSIAKPKNEVENAKTEDSKNGKNSVSHNTSIKAEKNENFSDSKNGKNSLNKEQEQEKNKEQEEEVRRRKKEEEKNKAAAAALTDDILISEFGFDVVSEYKQRVNDWCIKNNRPSMNTLETVRNWIVEDNAGAGSKNTVGSFGALGNTSLDLKALQDSFYEGYE